MIIIQLIHPLANQNMTSHNFKIVSIFTRQVMRTYHNAQMNKEM